MISSASLTLSSSESKSKWFGVPSKSVSAGVPYPSLSDTVPSVSTVPSTSPSLSASVKPASIASEIPSPSLSGSKWFGMVSLSVSAGVTYPSLPITFPSASTPVPLPSTWPSLLASVKPASIASRIPSLSESKST